MPPPPPPRSCAVLVVVAAVLLAVAVAASAQVYPDGWAADADDGYGVACTGTVGECAVARRELGGGGTIGYGALGRDHVPCSQRGASYYSGNCQPGAQANPYSRGCSAITQCRG